MKMNKTYSELLTFKTLKDRYDYLKIGGSVGAATFGGKRQLNQMFYATKEWKNFRKHIIARDGGFEMGVTGFEICGRIYVHHIVPITPEDILNRDRKLLDPENAISVSYNVHEAIHYADESLLPQDPIIRFPNDTCPWKL